MQNSLHMVHVKKNPKISIVFSNFFVRTKLIKSNSKHNDGARIHIFFSINIHRIDAKPSLLDSLHTLDSNKNYFILCK